MLTETRSPLASVDVIEFGRIHGCLSLTIAPCTQCVKAVSGLSLDA